jgi:hypothetical protein
MAAAIELLMGDQEFEGLRAHLLPPGNQVEQAAFGFARSERRANGLLLRLEAWLPIARDGFDAQSEAYLELRDGMSGMVIKRAHDMGACLIEFHCHMGPWPAMFSPSDVAGFEEFVPHAWWRLKGRPYAAVVMTAEAFDGLAWIEAADVPVGLETIQTPSRRLVATGHTIRALREGRYVSL